MPSLNSKHLVNLSLSLGLLAGTLVFLPDLAFADTLKGAVTEKHEIKSKPGLSRRDVDSEIDPFSGESTTPQDAYLDAPAEAFQVEKARQPFALQAAGSGRMPAQTAPAMPFMDENPFRAEEDMLPDVLQQQIPQPAVNPNDPDSSPEMQLAWDAWHRRVAESIYQRFNFLAKLGFRRSPPLICRVGYVVTRDGQIQNVQIVEKSTNTLFNLVVYQTVKSLNGDLGILQFPPGSKRMVVQKWGTFTQNYGGDGFRYTVGDRESLRR